jgi:hypothetical protein
LLTAFDVQGVMNFLQHITPLTTSRMYVLSTGCQWRYIPKDLPPRSTVNGYFCLWGWDGTVHRALPPPRLAGGISGLISRHSASVRSLG